MSTHRPHQSTSKPLKVSKWRWQHQMQQQQQQRLETRHVSSRGYVFLFCLLFIKLICFFRSTYHVETAMAAAATAAAGTRDASSPVITWLPLPRRLVVHFLYRKWLSLMLNKIDMVDLLFDGTHLFILLKSIIQFFCAIVTWSHLYQSISQFQ